MKHFFWFFMLLALLLTSCSGDGSGTNCKEGICVTLKVEGPVQSLKPALFTISVKTDKDISDLGISIYGDTSVSVRAIGKQPKDAVLTFQDEGSMDWSIDTKGGEEYIFTGHVIYPKPTVSYGIFHYLLIAAANKPNITRVTDSITIYLDAEGKEVDAGKAKIAEQTDYPPPTPPPDQTVIPETSVPSITPALPTETPSPTVPAYPAPEETQGAAPKSKTLPTPTPLAYPYP